MANTHNQEATMQTEQTTVEQLATEAVSWFERKTREDESQYTTLKDGRPEWLHELVRQAHGDMLPDDWRYEAIRDALDFISEGNDDSHEYADSQVDVYTAELTGWLSSGSRQSYCDQAIEEFGVPKSGSITDMIGMGQYLEALEVFESVRGSLESEAGSAS